MNGYIKDDKEIIVIRRTMGKLECLADEDENAEREEGQKKAEHNGKLVIDVNTPHLPPCQSKARRAFL